MSPERDPLFRVEVLNATLQPQTTVWAAMHQDYSEDFVFDEKTPPEDEAGRIAVKRLLAGERGHYGPLEHPQITFAVGFFPHSVMQQARTHRVGVSFDVQSLRYTGSRVCAAARGELHLEDVFYLRPVGSYSDRQGKRYEYSEHHRSEDLVLLRGVAYHYLRRVEHDGFAEEHARGLLAFDVRQHFVVSFTLRALLHFLDLRAKLDAQQEIRWLCDLMWPHLETWAPEIAAWYATSRLHKARLAP
jgi:thymidylate synthase (FAD)